MQTTYTYTDPGGSLTTLDHQNTTGIDASYQYDSYGRVISLTDTTGSKSYTYDDNDLPLTVTTTYTGLPAKTLSYQYYPDGSQQQLNSPAGIFTYQYDTDGAMTALTDPTGHTSRWTYLPDKQIQKQQLGNRAWTGYSYNLIGQLIGQVNYTAKGRVLSRFASVTRDDLDNITASTGILPGMPSQDGASCYTYDSFSQLTQSHWTPFLGGTAQAQTVTFDSAGNPTSFPLDLTGYAGMTRAYNSNNQWIGYYNAHQQLEGNNLFAYDGNGNPTTYKGDSLIYSDDNGLISYSSAANNQVSMSAGYCADGLRAWKSVNGTQTYFLYNGTKLLCELNASGNVIHYNINGTAGIVGRVSPLSSQITWYIFDDFGNVIHRFNASGKVISTDQYNAWGNTISCGDANDPYRYKGCYGYYTDHETNLILCTHRYYDPQNTRWINRDPIGTDGGINIYRYCLNNNLVLIDSDGYGGVSIGIGGNGEVGVAGGIGGQVSGQIGGFWGHGFNIGAFFTYGGFVGFKNKITECVGAIISAGVQLSFTNATSANQLKGPFQTYNIGGGWFVGGGVTLATSGNTWEVTLIDPDRENLIKTSLGKTSFHPAFACTSSTPYGTAFPSAKLEKS